MVAALPAALRARIPHVRTPRAVIRGNAARTFGREPHVELIVPVGVIGEVILGGFTEEEDHDQFLRVGHSVTSWLRRTSLRMSQADHTDEPQ